MKTKKTPHRKSGGTAKRIGRTKATRLAREIVAGLWDNQEALQLMRLAVRVLAKRSRIRRR